MQQNKVITNNSELEIIGTNLEQLTSALTSVMGKFQLQWSLSIFDVLKSKGLALSSLLSALVILPFYGVATIHQLMHCKLNGCEITGKKQAYYDAKNHEYVDWRKLLMYHTKRFIFLINNNINLRSDKRTALIFDDTLIEKTGKKMERVSLVHDHVSGNFVLGYKLLVCGFWDGESFIPVDFSLHRERGKKQEKLLKSYHNSIEAIEKQAKVLQSCTESQVRKQASYLKHKSRYEQKSTNTNKNAVSHAAQKQAEILQKQKQAQNEMDRLKSERTTAYNALKRYYNTGKLFGLTKKEREAQFKKAVSTKSHGFKRRKESDSGKAKSMLLMLGRAVAKGIVPDYVLVDSWFFSYELLDKLKRIKKGAIRLVAMARIQNQVFTVCSKDKDMSVRSILKTHESSVKRCKKLNAQYIKVPCFYKGIRLNLFFVRMGKCKTWRLLVTTDLSLTFIQLIEVYQIRWSIEVFFKDCKQHLNLSGCASNTFDAQIADITISMLQYTMLSYFKRLNYQQTIGGLFENIAKELEELDLISRLLEVFWALIKIVCEIQGMDFMELQYSMMKDDRIMNQMKKLIPKSAFREVA